MAPRARCGARVGSRRTHAGIASAPPPPEPASDRYVASPPAEWTLTLPPERTDARLAEVRAQARELAEQAPFGWGHTIPLGDDPIEGLLGSTWRRIVGAVDQLGWWPADLTGLRVADVGAFTGGVAMLLADRGAEEVVAVDELADHVAQTRLVADVYGAQNVRCVEASLYELTDHVTPGSVDLVVCLGVLYHLSDMLVGLIRLRELLVDGGTLVLETSAVEDTEHSYANFGRYVGGMWWQPTVRCVADLLEFAGFVDVETALLQPERVLVRATRGPHGPRFRRGLHLSGIDRADDELRTLDLGRMAPAPNLSSSTAPVRRSLVGLLDRLARLPMRLGYQLRRVQRRVRGAISR